MKKIILLLLIIGTYALISKNIEKENLIPSSAIRIRILASSNEINDQTIKKEVKENIEPYLFNLLKNVRGVDNAKKIITTNMTNIKNEIDSTIQGRQEYTINFGKNYFPKKEYKGITYDEGYYDSLLIKLGNGLGDNWWCVLFPPLCLLEGSEATDVQYSTYIGELIDLYF